MKLHLEKAIFVNRAPFEKLELDFKENEIAVLTAVNGRGKTTILSHIVDAFYEMAKPHFYNEFEGRANKFYRVSSAVFNLDFNLPSFVYLRFKIQGEIFDYLDIRNRCTQEQYDNAIDLENKILFNTLVEELNQTGSLKKLSSNVSKEKIIEIFSNNVLTYFPAYRFEMPGYLTDPYKVKLNFKNHSGFNGYLNNPIEVISGLPQFANWLMDIVLDMQYNDQLSQMLKNRLDLILSMALISRGSPLRFGVGPRGFGGTRIQIINAITDVMVYPSIFNISSGEAALLCLFGEIIRQADNNDNGIQISNVTGIILIDEIDKHLHIRLQKEVLPNLLGLFPNVQFIISSHSPFLSMGLAEINDKQSKIIDLDNLGLETDPETNQLYKEVYDMMVNENDRFKDLYLELKGKINENNEALIVTEGKTDIQHIKKAKEILQVEDFECEYFNAESESKVKTLLEQLSKIPQSRKIIGLFDRDVPTIISDIEKNNQSFKDYGNNVYAFCIPIPAGRENYNNVSIEFYYSDQEVKKSKDGKSLYFDNELNFDSKRKPISINHNATENFDKKIWCENIGDLDWIHSKSRFADIIETDPEFIQGIDFENFNLIFDKIRTIINL